MLKSMFVSSLVISQTLAADFEYPENERTQNWAEESVLGAGKTNYCGNTHLFQSPIDIDSTIPLSSCPTTKPLTWTILETNINKFKVENTGHNLKMIPQCCGVVDDGESGDNDDNDESNDSHDDSDDNPEFENLKSGTNFGVLTDIFGSMGTYCLDSFHIHWGQENEEGGSEHRIDSKQAAMEMHFVHRACKYTTVSQAIGIEIKEGEDSTADPTLAVVSVLFDEGDKNELIQKIVDQVHDLQTAESEIEIEASMFDVVKMNNKKLEGNYYHYKGSLTTPPCTPVVSWHVLEERMTVSKAQLQALRENIQNEHKHVGTSNFRGVKQNGHTVSKCKASGSDDDGDDDNEKDD